MKNINKLRVNGLSFGDLPARVDGMGRKSGLKIPSGAFREGVVDTC